MKHLLYKYPALFFLAIALIGGALLTYYFLNLAKNINEAFSIEYAQKYTEAIQEFRNLYIKKVTERVGPLGIKITHHYEDYEGAIPLPATLSMELAEKLGQYNTGLSVKLYTDHPVFSQKYKIDPLEYEALNALRHQPEKPFMRFVEEDGKKVLRYMTADVMLEGCVSCHHTHPESPNFDWKVGDVQSALEIIVSMDEVEAKTRKSLTGGLSILIFLIGAGLVTFIMIIRMTRRSIQENTEMESETKQLNRFNAELQNEISQRIQAEKALRLKNRELLKANADLEKFNKVAVGREMKMIELKKEIHELSKKLHQEPPRDISFFEDEDYKI